MIDHCVSRLKQISEEETYRIYVTDALKAITNNTAHLTKNGLTMTKRFSDFISKTPEEPDENDEIKAQEIKDHMKNILAKLGKEDG